MSISISISMSMTCSPLHCHPVQPFPWCREAVEPAQRPPAPAPTGTGPRVTTRVTWTNSLATWPGLCPPKRGSERFCCRERTMGALRDPSLAWAVGGDVLNAGSVAKLLQILPGVAPQM